MSFGKKVAEISLWFSDLNPGSVSTVYLYLCSLTLKDKYLCYTPEGSRPVDTQGNINLKSYGKVSS